MGYSVFGIVVVLVYFTESVVEAGPRCFECRDISSPLECGISTECSDYQECYVDQVVSSGGLVLYNTGCRSKQLCTTTGKRSLPLFVSGRQTTDLVTCSQCCQGEFCNEQGCGIKAPNPSSRGPNCFQCTNMLYTSECRQIVTCELGQLCMLYETNKAGTTLYDSRCESERVCKILATLPQPVGRRRQTGAQLCHSCCKGDYCNDKCNVSMTTVTNPTTSAYQPSTSVPIAVSTTTLSTRTMSTISTRAASISTSKTATSMTPTSATTMLSTAGSISAADRCRFNGFTYFSFVPFCFKVKTDQLSWQSANIACGFDGGTLAVIDTKLKWDILKVILSQDTALSNKFLWLGARDVNNNNTYYWETGDRVGFDNWRAGTPDGFASGDGGKCLSTMAADNFHWHNIICSTPNPFVCTKPI